MSLALLSVALRSEHHVVVARQRARQIARHLGFGAQDQARIATAVSEIARNVTQYAGEGRIDFTLEGRTSPQLLGIRVKDEGPGFEASEAAREIAPEDLLRVGGRGLLLIRAFMDEVWHEPPGNTILISKKFARNGP